MALRKITAAAVAAALVLSPTAAGASRAAIASAAAAQQEIDPAAETIEEGSELRRGGILIPLAGLLLIAIAIYLLTKDKKQRSP